jgi:hypothetical protein
MGDAGTQFADRCQPLAPFLLHPPSFFLQGPVGLLESTSERQYADEYENDRCEEVSL